MSESIEIWNKRLTITRYKGRRYIISDKKADLFIHVDKLVFTGVFLDGNWMKLLNARGGRIGSLWIKTDTDKLKVLKFLEEA